MQTLFTERKKRGLLRSGLGMVADNKRYILWFWLLNLTLAEFGTYSFSKSAHAILDHSLQSDRLLHRFDITVMTELFVRPEFGSMAAMEVPAFCFAFLFFSLFPGDRPVPAWSVSRIRVHVPAAT